MHSDEWLRKMSVRAPLLIIAFAISCFGCFCAATLPASDHHFHDPHSKFIINVDDFGTRGDGITDDSEAFENAWHRFCQTKQGVLLIPRRTYLLKPVFFSGPCNPNLKMKIQGTIKASRNKDDYKITERRNWILFRHLQHFRVDGGGVIDGNGEIWWKQSCNFLKKEPCDNGEVPLAVSFENCTNLKVKNLRLKNSQKMHLTFNESRVIEVSKLKIEAPGNSPNTDGIHITMTKDIHIKNSVIRTGDDCISIVNRSMNVRASGIVCGLGHGISIGSLGRLGNQETEYVSDVVVNRSRLIGTKNGVRIKTWQGGHGDANNIVFENIVMQNVTNPIIIDQFYCEKSKVKPEPCPEQREAVKISKVVYRNIRGTSAGDLAITFNCSNNVPCQGIVLDNVRLTGSGEAKNIIASCSQVEYITKGDVFPSCNYTDSIN
nr:polygalacturonase-like [Ipomoea batatas]